MENTIDIKKYRSFVESNSFVKKLGKSARLLDCSLNRMVRAFLSVVYVLSNQKTDLQ